MTLVVQVRSGDPARDAQKLQEITAAVDPTMEVEFVAGVAALWEREQRVVFAVGLLAAAGPARRGLAIEPTDALRTE